MYPATQDISSLTAILNTIQVDYDTQHWFRYLICQPAVRAQLSGNAGSDPYHALGAVRRQSTLFIILMILIAWLAGWGKMIWWLGVLPPIMILLRGLHTQEAALTAQISEQLLCRDFSPDQIKKMTLFQISEYYAKRYHLPSLVETVHQANQILQRAYLVLFFLPWPNIAISITILIIICLFLQTLLHQPWAYRLIRPQHQSCAPHTGSN